MSLLNLGTIQGSLERYDAALASTEDAVDLYRKLAERHPDAFLSELAASCDNLGILQSELGHPDAGMAFSQEAADIRRNLVAQRPDAFLRDFAVSLNNLAAHLLDLNRHHEALPVAQEALDAIWPYYEKTPAAHGDLVRKLIGLLVPLYEKLDLPLDQTLEERVKRYLALSGA